MSDYKAMYIELFNAVSDAIAELRRAQILLEEKYMEAEGE